MLCAVVKHGKYASYSFIHIRTPIIIANGSKMNLIESMCFCFILRTPINALLCVIDSFAMFVYLSVCASSDTTANTSVQHSLSIQHIETWQKPQAINVKKNSFSIVSKNVQRLWSAIGPFETSLLLSPFLFCLPEETSLGDLIQAKIELLRLGEQTTMKWCLGNNRGMPSQMCAAPEWLRHKKETLP